MNMHTMLSYDWRLMLPEFIILAVAVILSLLDLFLPGRLSRRPLAWIGLAGILLSLLSLIGLMGEKDAGILYDTFRLDSFSKAFKLLLLSGGAMVMLLAESYHPKEGMKEYRGEFYYLFLTGLLGAMMMASSGDLITLFTGLELLSVSTYILAGMRKKHLPSNEAAMKYIISGSIATAITLFGMSYLYGLTGTTNLMKMGSHMANLANSQFLYLIGLAFFMIVGGLSFKLASAPFHMWAPDVYEGSPAPVTAFLSTVSKTAGFVILIRIIWTLFFHAPGDEFGAQTFLEKNNVYLSLLAALSIIIGNVTALRQRNIKRLFGYSSIAHAGYLLVSIVSIGAQPFFYEATWFYLLAYLLMNMGAFAVIQVITVQTGSEDISSLAGLYKRSPRLACTMAVFILSLAGIPGTAGFIGKVYIFMGAFSNQPAHYVLASILIGGTIVSYIYYFGIMTQMFFRPVHTNPVPKVPAGIIVVLVLCLTGTILFGVAPNLAINLLK
ncbi:NADH-quinone oxidoreductase subunit NuoN [Peribacillus sp. B-H-3]|uniref:NADH-quinone oxidoreductase subunit NuoN n=1 Tax=Peribacillus sp. B-H-3 TaxID=3400420 RepID=UPI003B0275E1